MKYINKTYVVSGIAAMALFGLGIFALKRFGGPTGAKVADTVNQ